MSKVFLDMENFPRKAHFEHFSKMAFPWVGITANVDITAFRKEIKEKGEPFFLALLYRTVLAGNSVPEFRQRISGGKIVQYDFCRASFTLALSDGTYCYCKPPRYDLPFEEFLPLALDAEKEAKENAGIEDGDDAAELFFVSSMPWVSFTSVIEPFDYPADSNPRLMFGKFFEQEGKTFLPVSTLTHHALTDGRHIGAFYENLLKLLNGEKI